MSLLELLLASSLFLGSSAASLAVWGQASVLLAEDRDRLRRLDALDAEMDAQEARLRDPALALATPSLACAERLRRLAAALQAQPAQDGVARQVVVSEAQDSLQLRLSAGHQERVRLYSPAAFGGCAAGPAAAPQATGDGASGVAATSGDSSTGAGG